MPTRAQVCAWIAAGVLIAPAAGAQESTEREVVDLIVRDGPQARAIRAQVDVVRNEQSARRAYPNPRVAYSREGAGVTEFLQVEQLLPVFGSRGALSPAGTAATAAAEADRDARLWILRAEAATAVARLSAAQVRLDLAQAHVREVERLIELLRTREREGEGSRFDRLRAEQELRETRQLVTAGAIDAAEARAMVTAMLPAGVTLGAVSPTARTTSPPAPPLDVLTTRGLASRAELRGLERVIERADLESEAAHRARRPEPYVTGGLKRAETESGRERGGVFGVSVTLPLFDSGDRDAARWAAERARLQEERAAVERQIHAEITRASDALRLRETAVAEDVPGAGDELARIGEVAYREGEVGILQLLDAIRTAARARIRSLELQLDARLARIALERAVGEILWP